tara:strand:- start:1378 stop:1584 length:207 start_codon:yes stop_codon:yes gene_type:complete
MGINSEGDLELGIKTMLKLAAMDGRKTIMISFPSKTMCDIFFENLLYTFEYMNIQEPVNIDAILVLPE